MALIQCKLRPVETQVGGEPYVFRADAHGRFVTEVHNIVHQMCFLSVEHYELAFPIADAPAPPLTPSEPEPAVTAQATSPAPAPVAPIAPARRGKRR